MDFSQIVGPLLSWYAANARALPWRSDPTPYRVWISEIMLQQTRVEAAKPYFERFVREVPDLPALAALPEERLLKLWEGLGYYSRARNLKKAAQTVMERYGGSLPADVRELRSLPGIGEYTAGAVASIGFGLPEPAVDGNVLRVAARLCASRRDAADPAGKRELAEKLRKVYPPGHAGEFTQALMELGATVCIPNGEPLCDRCPLSSLCEGKKTGRAASFPVKTPKPARKTEDRTVFLILCVGRAAIRRRPGKGLLAGLWEFPCAPGRLSPQEAEEQLQAWGLSPSGMHPLPKAKHVFTHLEWHMTGYFALAGKENSRFTWVRTDELFRSYALPSAYRVYLDALGKLRM